MVLTPQATFYEEITHLKEEMSRLVEVMKLIRQDLFGEAEGLEQEPRHNLGARGQARLHSLDEIEQQEREVYQYMRELLRP